MPGVPVLDANIGALAASRAPMSAMEFARFCGRCASYFRIQIIRLSRLPGR